MENVHREFGNGLSLLRMRLGAREDVNNLLKKPRKKETNLKPHDESRKGGANMLQKKKPVDESD